MMIPTSTITSEDCKQEVQSVSIGTHIIERRQRFGTMVTAAATLLFGMLALILSLHNGAASSTLITASTVQCHTSTRHDNDKDSHNNERFLNFVCSSNSLHNYHDQSRRKVQEEETDIEDGGSGSWRETTSTSVIKQLHVTVLDMSNGKILCQDTTDENGYYQCAGIQADTVIQIVFTSLDGTSTASTQQFNISDSGNHSVSAGTSSEGVVFLDMNGNGQYDDGEEGDHAAKRMPSAAPSVITTISPTSLPTGSPTLHPSIRPSSYPTLSPTKSEGKSKPTSTTAPTSSPVSNITITMNVTDAPTLSPTSKPTLSPSTTPATCENSPEVRQNILFRLLMNVTAANPLLSEEAMALIIDDGDDVESFSFDMSNITTNAQGLAFKWMLTTDTILSCPASAEQVQQAKERFILATLYYATGGQFSWSNCGRTMTDGKLDSDLCETHADSHRRFMSPHHHHCLWYGITCNPDSSGNNDQQQYVTGIDLANNTLIGYFPSEFVHLTDLTFLKLDNNRIGGVLPTDIGSMSTATLTSLDLDNNEMGGPLPDSLYDLSELQRLDLNSNKFHGTLSSRIGLMSNLVHIQLQDNLLDGSLPYELGNLDKLNNLLVNSNQFYGAMPLSVCQLRSANLMHLWSDCYPDQDEDNLIAVDCPCCTECWPVQPDTDEEDQQNTNTGGEDQTQQGDDGSSNGNINREESRFEVLSCNSKDSKTSAYSQTISSMTLEFSYKVETLMRLQDLYPLLDNVILDLVAPWLLSCDEDDSNGNGRRLMPSTVRTPTVALRILASSVLPGVGSISSVPSDVVTGTCNPDKAGYNCATLDGFITVESQPGAFVDIFAAYSAVANALRGPTLTVSSTGSGTNENQNDTVDVAYIGPDPSPFQILETSPKEEKGGGGGTIEASTFGGGSQAAIDQANFKGPAAALGAILSVLVLSICALVYRRYLTLKDKKSTGHADFQDCDDDYTTPTKVHNEASAMQLSHEDGLAISIVSGLGNEGAVTVAAEKQFWEFGGSTPVSKEKEIVSPENGSSRYDIPGTSPTGNMALTEDEFNKEDEENDYDKDMDMESNKKNDKLIEENDNSTTSSPFMVVNHHPAWSKQEPSSSDDNVPAMPLDMDSVAESQFTTGDEWNTIGGDDSTFQYSTSGKTFGSQFV